MGDAWFRQAFGAHYPLLYQHRDAAEAQRCLALLPRLASLVQKSGEPILDLGCGDGRHLELLRESGHAAVGLDLSAALLRIARFRSRGRAASGLVRGDMRILPFADATFSAVLSLFTAFGYFEGPRENLKPVKEVGRVLTAGGHWFLDYFDGDQVRAELKGKEPQLRQRELGPLVVREVRELVADETVVEKRVHLQARSGCLAQAKKYGISASGLEYTERVAVFSLDNLDTMAGQAGLTRVAAAGGYDGEPLGAGNRWILVFRKNTKDSIL